MPTSCSRVTLTTGALRNTIKAFSERRVEIAKQFLVKLGVPEANLGVKALGEEQNMTPEQMRQLIEQHPNLTEEQRKQNPEELADDYTCSESASGYHFEQ